MSNSKYLRVKYDSSVFDQGPVVQHVIQALEEQLFEASLENAR